VVFIAVFLLLSQVMCCFGFAPYKGMSSSCVPIGFELAG
jgi:hypothetical protein